MVKDKLNLTILAASIALGVVPNALLYKYYSIDLGLYLFDLVMLWLFLQSLFCKKERNPKIDLVIIATSLFLSLTLILNIKHLLAYSSYLYLLRFTIYLLSYPYFLRVKDKGLLQNFFKRLVVFTVPAWLVVFLFYPNIVLSGFDPHIFRLYGPFLDPNYYSIFLVLAYLYILYAASTKKSLPLLFLIVLSLFLTFSRLGLLLFVIGNIFLAIKSKNFALTGVLVGIILAMSVSFRYILRFTFFSGHFKSFFYKVISFYEGLFLYNQGFTPFGFNNIETYRYHLMSNTNNVSTYFDFFPFNLLLTGGLVFVILFTFLLIFYAVQARGIYTLLVFSLITASFGMNIAFNPIFFILLIIFVTLSVNKKDVGQT